MNKNHGETTSAIHHLDRDVASKPKKYFGKC